MTQIDTTSREKFVDAATRLFADRGFYGASIAAIADELGLTKQALLHHFGTKDKLYGLVLERVSARFMNAARAAQIDTLSPEQRLAAFFAGFCAYALDQTDHSRVFLRELLDNRHRPEQATRWYLKPFLDLLIDMVQSTKRGRRASDAEALVLLYPFLGSISYFAVAEPTLTQMYGPDVYADMRGQFEDQLITSVMATFAG